MKAKDQTARGRGNKEARPLHDHPSARDREIRFNAPGSGGGIDISMADGRTNGPAFVIKRADDGRSYALCVTGNESTRVV